MLLGSCTNSSSCNIIILAMVQLAVNKKCSLRNYYKQKRYQHTVIMLSVSILESPVRSQTGEIFVFAA